MIKFSLNCENAHNFDSWFQSSDAFETLKRTRMLSCPMCGSLEVDKGMMAPRIGNSDSPPSRDTVAQVPINLEKPGSKLEKAVLMLKREVERNSDYVGQAFASEARAMHSGELPQRPIYGEARMDEARELVAEGISVMPLPWYSTSNAN